MQLCILYLIHLRLLCMAAEKIDEGQGNPYRFGGKMGWYGMVFQLGLSASLLAGRIAESPLTQLPPSSDHH